MFNEWNKNSINGATLYYKSMGILKGIDITLPNSNAIHCKT